MVPVVWVCGAPGVGKSVATWELFRRSSEAGYLDIDQVGMLYPEQEDDGAGHLLKQRALQALRGSYESNGARQLLVSGVVDPELVVDPVAPVPRADVRYYLLIVGADALRRRLIGRGWTTRDADEAVDEQAALADAGFADTVIETTSMSPSEVADRVAAGVTSSSGARTGGSAPPVGDDSTPATPAVLVTGPRAAGCSTVGFGLARRAWDGGTRTGFADLGQLAFLRQADRDGHSDLGLGLANLSNLRNVFATLGAERFVANGHLCDRPAPDTTVVRLRADAATLRDHIRSRLGGDEARLTGDDLAAATPAHQDSVLRQALAEQELLERAGVGDLVVDVSGRTVDDVVSEIEGFLGQASTSAPGRGHR